MRRPRHTRGDPQPVAVDASKSVHNWRHPSGAQQEGGKVKRRLRKRDDRTGNIRYRRHRVDNRRNRVSNRRHRVSNRRHRVSNRRDRVSNRRDQVGNRRDRVRNRRDQVGNRATGLGALGTRTASSFWSSVSVPPPLSWGSSGRGKVGGPSQTSLVRPVDVCGCLPARTNRARYIPNGLPHSVSNITDSAVSRRAALRWRVSVFHSGRNRRDRRQRPFPQPITGRPR